MTKRRSYIYAFVFGVLITLVLAGCGEMDSEADPRVQIGSEPEGRILFAADGDIHMWNGSSSERITDVGDASSPAWSSNRTQYMFVRTGDAYSDLILANINTGEMRNVTGNQPGFTPGTPDYLSQVAWAMDPVFSPAGTALAYVSDVGTDKNFLWHRSSVDTDPWRVPCSQRTYDNVERPDFSPDGSQVVFAQRSSGPADLNRWMDIKICDLNTGELTVLTEGDVDEASFYPRWSPDGEWIAFVRRLDGQSNIWVMPAEGGDAIQLTDEGDVTAPEWSPDGNFIAFLDPEGSSFRAAYIEFDVGANGTPSASDSSTLFNEDGLDGPSGLSWIQ